MPEEIYSEITSEEISSEIGSEEISSEITSEEISSEIGSEITSEEISSETPYIYTSTVDLSTVESKLEEIRIGVGFCAMFNTMLFFILTVYLVCNWLSRYF